MTTSPLLDDLVQRDVVVVGASAGGVESLRTFVSLLPEDLPALVLVVLHIPPTGPNVLDRILERVSRLPVGFSTGGEDLRPGRVLVAPPDRHLIVHKNRLLLSRGPRENGYRPAVDVLFRSAARALDQRVVSVVLSGTLDDGTAGAVTVDQRGGVVLAQDPDEAAYPGMPMSVVANIGGARTAGVPDLAAEVDRLCRSPALRLRAQDASQVLTVEVELAAMDESASGDADRPGVPVGFGCPECYGSMLKIEDDAVLRFRCRVGHAWTAAGLLGQQPKAMEGALWMARRRLEEKGALSRQLSAQAQERGNRLSARRFDEQSVGATQSAGLVRHLIESVPALSVAPDSTGQIAVNDG